MKAEHFKVFGEKGCGSVIVETAMACAGVAYDREEVAYEKPGPSQDKLRSFNPLGQVPTVICEDGSIMTESLAIIHYLQALNPKANLVPPTTDLVNYRRFLRWSTFLVSAIYPTFTYGDSPAKWTSDGSDQLRTSTDEHRKKLFMMMEHEAGDPWFLGEQFSAIDLYLKAMTHWRPGFAWFQEHTPKITDIARRTHELSALTKIWDANFS